MAAYQKASKQSKWFSSKSLKLSLRRRSKSQSNLSCPSSPTSMNGQNSGSQEDELREVFRYFDGDGDGRISPLELRAYFASIGEYMSNEDARAVIAELDSDGDNLLDFQDFLKLMKREEAEDEDLRKAFEMFELEKGDGCITPKGLQKMLHRLGDPKSLEECASMIQVYDTDGNGVVDYDEFQRMMMA